MKNILIVNVNWLGDVIFSSPIFKALKSAYPKARVSCLAVPRVKEILESTAGLDEIIIYDERGKHGTPWGKAMLIGELRKRKFDVAFLLHQSWTRALLVFLAGIPQRIGYDTKGRGIFLTRKVKEPPATTHRSDHYLHVVESQGIPIANRRCVLKVSPDEDKAVEKKLLAKGIGPGDKFVLINPGGNWSLKRWPAGNFSLLIESLQKKGQKVILVGSAADKKLVEEITASLSNPPIVLTGETTLKELLALMKKAEVVVSADSGPLHLASSVGTKTIGLFGPTSPDVTGCRGSQGSVLRHDVGCNRAPCYHLSCCDNICMQSITLEEVVEAFG